MGIITLCLFFGWEGGFLITVFFGGKGVVVVGLFALLPLSQIIEYSGGPINPKEARPPFLGAPKRTGPLYREYPGNPGAAIHAS